MWATLIKHHIKASFRSPLLHESTFARVMSGVIIFFLSLQLIALGIGAPILLQEKSGDVNLQQTVYGLILFFAAFDLAMRTILQKAPSFNLTPYLLQPIKKRKLAGFMLVRSWISYTNLYQHIFLLPFMLMFAHQSNTWHLLGWHYGAIIIILLLNHHLTLLMHYKLRPLWVRLIPIALIIALIALQYTGAMDIFQWGQKFFLQAFKTKTLFFAVAIAVTILLIYRCLQVIRQQMYKLTDNEDNAKNKKATTIKHSKNPYLFLLSTLVSRNKRLRTSFYSFILLWFMCIVYIFHSPIEESAFFNVFWLLLFFSPGIVFGQFMNSWESSFFDTLMANAFNWNQYYKTQYYIFSVASITLFILAFPFILWQLPHKAGLSISILFFVLGFIYPLVFYSSIFNRKKIDLQRSSLGNMQGSGVSQFFAVMAIFYLTPLVYIILHAFLPEVVAILILGFLGLTGIFLHPYWIQHVTQLNLRKKYIRLENYKE